MNELDIKERLQNYSLDLPSDLKERTFERYRRREAERRRRLGMATGAFVLSALTAVFVWTGSKKDSADYSPLERQVLYSESRIGEPEIHKVKDLKNLKHKSVKTIEKDLQTDNTQNASQVREADNALIKIEKQPSEEQNYIAEAAESDQSSFGWEEPERNPKYSRKAGKLSLRITGSAAGGASSMQNFAATGNAGAGAQGYSWADKPRLGIALYNKGEQTRQLRQHFSPLRVGLAFNYEFYPSWSIESGVSYKQLSSEFSEGSSEHYIKGYQRIHYIGIPLKMDYEIIRFDNLRVYVGAGLILDKCIQINQREEYFINGEYQSSQSLQCEEKPFQLSLEATAGMDYKINDRIGVFTELSAGWYFDDASNLNTIYKERPLNLGLNIGLRFGF
ncbi:MAG: outer membrane beta-barrel protein [Candidatus Cryptobacteroides sp.]